MVLEVHQVAITTIHESPLGGKKKKKLVVVIWD